MKKIHILSLSFLFLLLAGITACKDNYDRPPLTEPKAPEGLMSNITIAQLKQLYKDVKDPTLIDVDYVLKATVIGNDVSGNIYKQLYVQDNTGGINLGIDYNSLYARYHLGQSLFLKLKGLYIVNYGDQLQIGFDKTQANRIPYEMFDELCFVDGWPTPENAAAKVITMGDISESLVNTLVQFEGVYFVEGGKVKFSDPKKTTNRILKDAEGRQIILRNSNYASFANDELPAGVGTVVGVLSKFRSDYQLLIRSREDVHSFSNARPTPTPDKPAPVGKPLYEETFGKDDVSSRPYLEDYKGFSEKSVVYTQEPAKVISVRTVKSLPTPHLWIPGGKAAKLVISDIDTSAGKDLVLSYEVAANLYDPTDAQDIDAIRVTVDGKPISVPSKQLQNKTGDHNKVYVVTLNGIPAKKSLTITFESDPKKNLKGFRLLAIRIAPAVPGVEPVRAK